MEDYDLLRVVDVDYLTLEWYNGVDFAPERLYEVGKAA